MKPLHVGLLIAAGALGGAVVMRVVQRPQPVASTTPIVVQAQPVAPPPAPVAPPEPVPVATPGPVPAEQPPVAAKPVEQAAKTARYTRPSPFRPVQTATPAVTPPPATYTKPEFVAKVTPAPPQDYAQRAQPGPPAKDPAPPVTPAAEPVPPARPEPEHVTPPPPPAPPEPHKVTLNAGTLIPVRLVDGLNAERNQPGDLFTATLDKELVVDGFVIAERGARVEGRVDSIDRGGKVRGVSSLGVEITRLRLSDGQTISVNSDPFERRAEATHGEDAAKIGAGAALGAVIGAIAGGGKGAAIGAGAGTAAGAGTVMATRGRVAALPSETRITFRLREPVTVTERR